MIGALAVASVPAAALPPAPLGSPPRVVRPVAVFGIDERAPLPAATRSLEGKIGILYEAPSRSVCTAFCVDASIIATAAHCLYRTSGEAAPRLSGFTFRLSGAQSRTPVPIAGADRGGAGQNVIAGSTRLSISPPIEATQDWALVRLARPACTTGGLKVGRRPVEELKALAEAGRVYHVAYHRDMPAWRLSRGGPCWMRRGEAPVDRQAIDHDFADTRDLVLHTCDTGPASSGSPLLIDGPDGPEVIAINVGTYVRSRVMMQNGEVVHRYKTDTIANTAVGSLAFADRLVAFAGAEILQGRKDIVALQGLLRARGHYAGPIDGTYGPKLRSAIESYERSERRPVSGMATAALLHQLAAAAPATTHTILEGHAIETGSIGKPARKSRPEPGPAREPRR